MAVQAERDDATWYECETRGLLSGLLFDGRSDATQRENRREESEPSYIQ